MVFLVNGHIWTGILTLINHDRFICVYTKATIIPIIPTYYNSTYYTYYYTYTICMLLYLYYMYIHNYIHLTLCLCHYTLQSHTLYSHTLYSLYTLQSHTRISNFVYFWYSPRNYSWEELARTFGIKKLISAFPNTQRFFFEILLSETEIRLYLPCSDWFGTANRHCPFTVTNQSENGKYNLISVWFNKI